MIKVYYIEDLSVEDVDALIEKGEVFDVVSKTSILQSRSAGDRDSFWGDGDRQSNSLRHSDT